MYSTILPTKIFYHFYIYKYFLMSRLQLTVFIFLNLQIFRDYQRATYSITENKFNTRSSLCYNRNNQKRSWKHLLPICSSHQQQHFSLYLLEDFLILTNLDQNIHIFLCTQTGFVMYFIGTFANIVITYRTDISHVMFYLLRVLLLILFYS